MLVLRHLFDSARTRFRISSGSGFRLCLFCPRGRRGFMLGIVHLVFRMTSFPMCLKILRFCFGTARAKLDEWERVENRTCKNAATTSASVSCSSSGTVTLGVPYSSDYLS